MTSNEFGSAFLRYFEQEIRNREEFTAHPKDDPHPVYQRRHGAV